MQHLNGAPLRCRQSPGSGSQQGKPFSAIPSQSSLLNCVDRTVRALWVWNEYIVAELILPRNQVFLSTFPFSDLIMTLGIATENSGRFPGCVENLRRRDFKVVVKNVRLRQMQPFENVHVAIVRYPDRLADRAIGLRRDRRGIDHQRL